MNLEEFSVSCPYCGELIDLLVDPSLPEQDYIEDCQVCCRPIDIHVRSSAAGELAVDVRHEDQ